MSWTKYSPEEREIINLRLEQFKIQILKRRFKIFDSDLFASKLDEKAINFNHSLDPLTWIFDLLRAAGSQPINLTDFGIENLVSYDPKTIKDEINDELRELSEVHFERYFKEAN